MQKSVTNHLKRIVLIIGWLIAVNLFTACKQSSDGPVSIGQPAVSIAQRQRSILTPTIENKPIHELTPTEHVSDTSIPATETQSPGGTQSDPTNTPLGQSPTSAINSTATPDETTNELSPELKSSDTPNAEPIPVTATAQAGDTGSDSCDPKASSTFEAEVIALLNVERGEEGVPPLSIQSQLTTAARNHSDDMTCNDFFSHNSASSGSPFERLDAVGYSYSWAGENIAAGYASPVELVEGWMNSEGHRENILNANFIQVGIGYSFWSDSEFGAYWTAVFASP